MSDASDPTKLTAFAEKTRALAATVHNDDTRQSMLAVATAYDTLALQAQHWAEQLRLLCEGRNDGCGVSGLMFIA
jgi:hypothetical protein